MICTSFEDKARKTMPRGAPRPRASADEGIRANVAGIRVKDRRQSLDMTQQELTAKLAFVSQGKWNPAAQEVLRLESGRRGILDIELIYLSKALSCSASWLLGEDGAIAPPDIR